jgi:hypothetical protein
VIRTLGPSIIQGGSIIIIIVLIIIVIVLLGSRHAPDPEEDALLKKQYRVKRI